ncbi:MAG: DUF2807 domain-containing protein [Saprospiraceae bacterium]|nr:DUF2807 domain-containing protein [Saprospiraceae bacterium]
MKTSNKILTSGLAVLFTILLASAIYIKREIFAQTKTIRTETTKAESTLENFSGISVEGNYDVNITKGDPKISIQGEKEFIDKIDYFIKENRLIITQKGENRTITIRSNSRLTINVFTNELNDVHSAGNSDININSAYESENIKLSITGNGDIVSQFSGKNIDVNSVGNGEIKNTGKSENLEITQLGNGDILFYGSPADNATVSLTGNGTIKVHCNTKLDANLIGNGDIRYKGEAQVSKNKTGNGDISKDE